MLLDDAKETIALLHFVNALSPVLTDQRRVLCGTAIMLLTAEERGTAQLHHLGPLRADSAIMERTWTMVRRRIETLLIAVKPSQRDLEGAERLAWASSAMLQLVTAFEADTVIPPWARWSVQTVTDAAARGHQLRDHVSSDEGAASSSIIREVAFTFIQIGRRLILGVDEDYAIEEIDAFVSIIAAMSLTTLTERGRRITATAMPGVVELDPLRVLLGLMADLVRYSRIHERFRTAFLAAFDRMLQTVLAPLFCDADVPAMRSLTAELLRRHWRSVAAEMALLVPVEALRCWRVDCPTFKPERLHKCASCVAAVCASGVVSLPADRSQIAVRPVSARQVPRIAATADTEQHWPTHRRLCAVLKGDDAL